MKKTTFDVGQLVQVRTKEEILATLDANGRLDGLPFMPEMLKFCGRQFRIAKRAHKTCDTVFPVRGRRMADAVHLETRCEGDAHGGCEAGCLIFWKNAWLQEAGADTRASQSTAVVTSGGARGGCAEEDVFRNARRADVTDGEPAYVCQATQLPYATSALSHWNLSQYVEDYTSGNVSLGKLVSGLGFASYRFLINLGIGLGVPLRWLYDAFQRLRNGVPYPLREGKLPLGAATPTTVLNVQPGELVRVKSYDAILATCDKALRNRGMSFDKEMVPYCGGVFRVQKRVNRIVDEKTGKMLQMKNPCVVLDGAYCKSQYSECRLFCPRSIYCYWREIWLERVESLPK